MAKVTLSERDRYAIFVQVNGAPVEGRAAQRRMDRLWTSLELDPIAARAEGSRQGLRLIDFDPMPKEFEITSDERDLLIESIERPMTAGLSRVLYPVAGELIKARDGERA